MDFNSYGVYSAMLNDELKNSTDVEKAKEVVNLLKNFDDETSVKRWLNEKWGIKDNIRNFSIAQNVMISAVNGAKYFNVTVSQDKKVQSYNFRKGDRI